MKSERDRHPRSRERWLLGLAGLFVAFNQSGLIVVQSRGVSDFWPLLVWAGCTGSLHLVLNRRLPHRDPFLLPAMMLLVGWGLNLIDRLQPTFADRQTVWMIVGSCAVVTLTYLPDNLRWLRRYRYTWLALGLSLLAVTIRFGVNPADERGPRLWLGVAGLFYQPSELVKILLVVFMASYLADRWITLRHEMFRVGRLRLPSLSFLAPMLLMWGVCVVILVWQRDLGTATIFFVIFMAMLYLASGQWLLLVGGGALLAVAAAVAYRMFDVVALRIDIWLNPWPEAEGRSFQIVQSLMAVSAGGILGQGIGQGSPNFIPVVHTDFVFAAIAEEWGLIGVSGLLLILALIVTRALRIALGSQHRPFAAFLAAGLGIMLATQSLLIMGGTLRLWPLTGVTLPFVSYGGSSLLTSFVAIGLLLVLSESEGV